MFRAVPADGQAPSDSRKPADAMTTSPMSLQRRHGNATVSQLTTIWLFVQQLVQTRNKENAKALS